VFSEVRGEAGESAVLQRKRASRSGISRSQVLETQHLDTRCFSALVEAIRVELEQAGRLQTSAGSLALLLAGKLGSSFDTGSSVAAVSRELRATLEQALEGATVATDPGHGAPRSPPDRSRSAPSSTAPRYGSCRGPADRVVLVIAQMFTHLGLEALSSTRFVNWDSSSFGPTSSMPFTRAWATSCSLYPAHPTPALPAPPVLLPRHRSCQSWSDSFRISDQPVPPFSRTVPSLTVLCGRWALVGHRGPCGNGWVVVALRWSTSTAAAATAAGRSDPRS
jgi:hypothetical protein